MTLLVKVEGDVEARWAFMESWQVGETMHWLWLSQQCWENDSDLNVDKYPKNALWTIQILHHVGSATNLCAWCSKGWYCQCNVGSRTVGCCEHIAAVLWLSSYQRNQAGDVSAETNFCGTVNVLEVVDTNWESKWRSSKWSTTSIRFFIQSTKVHQQLFYYFHNPFFLIKVDFFLYQNIDIIHIHQISWRFNVIF